MYKVEYYVSYDGCEFKTREECEQYERDVMESCKKVYDTYDFLDEDKVKVIDFDENALVIDVVDGIENAYQKCVYVRTKEKPTENFNA